MKQNRDRFRTLWLLLAILASACSSSHGPSSPGDSVLVPALPGGRVAMTPLTPTGSIPNSGLTGSGTATGSASPRSPLAGGLVSIGEPTREQYCNGSGPPIAVQFGLASSANPSSCVTGLASQLFQYGLCSCNEAVFAGAFAIDALDSRASQLPPGQAASVGINGDLASAGVLDLAGSLIAAGGGLMPIASGSYTISGDYRARGDLVATGANIRFGRDLWVDGDILGLGLVSVQGDVHQTPGHTQSGMDVRGQVLSEAFTIAPPCACGDDQILDIDAIVAAGKQNSHNRDIGLPATTLVNVGIGTPLELECGRFAFDGGYLVGATHITVRGRTALFVDGDLVLAGAFGIDFEDQGELDVFVSGNLVLTGAGDVGTRARPSALRFYVGGSGDIAIAGANRFAANLYAPRANVFVAGADDIYGAFFVGSYNVAGAQRMHYDPAVRDATTTTSCKNPPSNTPF